MSPPDRTTALGEEVNHSSRSAVERVLIWASAARDADLTARVLAEADLDPAVCPSIDLLRERIEEGAGLVVVGEEALGRGADDLLLECFERQPVWSDLPLIVLARDEGAIRKLLNRVAPRANATLLERPVRLGTLISAARAALRARRRQYEVRDLVERLAEQDRRKDEFLAMLGHELRNPLGAMATAIALLERSDADPVARRRHVKLARNQIHHLTRMMDDLLDLSRLSRGRIELRTEPTDVVAVVERAVDSVDLAQGNGGGRFEMSRPDQPLTVDGDPVRLEQVVANLLRNAVKYTSEEERIEVTVGRNGDRAQIRVRDQGIGIAAEDLETVFDRFARHAPLHGETEGGLGLGLYLTRQLVELHGGTVTARSAGRGAGSEFVVTLPLVGSERSGGSEATARSQVPESEDHGAEGIHVLLVEDNQDGREALRELLELWGCRVRVAATGAEAIELALEEPPDVALIDIGLPDLDGYEVARRVRSGLGEGRGHLVALTGFGQPSDRRQALEAGFDDHVVKPVAPGVLSSLLKSVGSRVASREARRATK